MLGLTAELTSRVREYVRTFGIVLFLVFMLGDIDTQAQLTTATVVGTVSDSTGAVLPNAKAAITNLSTQIERSAETNDLGDYTFTLLPPGDYRLLIEQLGFQTFTVSVLTLAAGDHVRVDARMQPGQQRMKVEVLAQVAPALQTETSTVQDEVTQRALQDLPLNGRNFINLVQLTAGANQGPPNALNSGTRPDDRRLTTAISVNGQGEILNNQLIDGLDNNERVIGTIGVRPSVEAISEVHVQTNEYSAEAGRAAGAVVNIITKSGTNTLHGTVYEFFRNDVLDARNYFATVGRKPELRQNQFGASIGGPVIKNRTFFFGDYEGFRLVQGQTFLSTVPTLFEEQHPGNFSDIGGPILSLASINPVALNYFKLYPAPNLPGTVNNFESAPQGTQFSHTFDVRVDHHFNDANTFFARYSFNHVDTFTPAPLPPVKLGDTSIQPGGNVNLYSGPSTVQAQNIHLNYVHIFQPDLLLELKAAYTRTNIASLPLNFGTTLNSTVSFLIPGANLPNDPATFVLAPLLPQGYASVGDANSSPIYDLDNTFDYAGAVTYSRGAHNIKFGAALIRRQFRNDQPSGTPSGQFVFSANYSPSFGSSPTGVSLASMLLGDVFQESRGNSPFPTDYRTWEVSGYVQDDWRATNWLTLNLGMRYDLFTPFTEANNRISNFDLATQQFVAASPSDSTAGVQTNYSNLAPRVGFAATLAPETVLRGGFGMTYYPTNYTLAASLKNFPYTFSYGPVAGNLADGIPAPSAQPGSFIWAEAFNYRSAYNYQFNLVAQRQFGANVVSLGYLGELGRRLPTFTLDVNQHAPSPTTLPLPFPNVGRVILLASEASSNYDALQVEFQRRYKNGFLLSANYCWAHGLNDAPDLSEPFSSGYGIVPGEFARRDYGNSDLDIRQRFALTAVYEVPFGKSSAGVERALFHGWQVNGIASWQTGLPFTVVNSYDVSNTGTFFGDRPDQIASSSLPNPSIQEWFNTAAFAQQPFGTLGNEGRNQLYGPHLRRVDLSLFKSVALREPWWLQFRAEVFNVSNTPSFANPNATLGLPGFGEINSTAQNIAREVQFGVKLLF